MANAERIDEIISPEALQQVDNLNSKLTVAVNNFSKALENSKKLDAALQGAKGLREIQKQVEVLTENQKKLDAEQKAIIKSTNDLAKANAKLALSETEVALETAKVRAQQELTNKATKQTARDALGLIDAYEKLSIEHVKLRREAKNVALQHGVTSDEFKLAADRANKYDEQLKKIDFALGQYGRNVGNYASATMSVSQVLRELPAFTYSVQTGLLGVSNNLPILIDQFKELSVQIDHNTGKQLGAIKAFKIMAGSLLSFTNLFTLGFSLLTMFGDKIFDSLKKSKKATDDARKSNEEYVKSLSAVSQARLKGSQNAQKELTDLKLLFEAYTNNNIPLKQRKEAYSKIQELYPSYFGNMKFEKEASEKTKTAYDQLTQSILSSAKARAAADLIAEKEGQKLVIEQKITDLETKREGMIKRSVSLKKQLDKAGDSLGGDVREANEEFYKLRRLIAENIRETSTLDRQRKALALEQLELEKKVNEEIVKGGKVVGGVADPNKDGDDAAKKAEDLRKREIKAQHEYQQLLLSGQADYYKSTYENEANALEIRLEALSDYNDIQAEILGNDAAFKIKNEELTATEIKSIKTKLSQSLVQLSTDTMDAEQSILEQSYNRRVEIVKEGLSKQLKRITESASSEQERIEEEEGKALLALAKKYKAGLISTEEYEKLKAEIQYKYTVERIKAEIQAAKDMLAVQEAAGQDVSESKKKLSELEKKYSDETAKHEIKNAEDAAKAAIKAAEDVKKKKEELAEELQNTLVAFFDGNIERQKNEIQIEKDAVDVRKQADIEKVNSSLATEAEKADKLAVINARAQAQKEALERRQRQLDEQKARFDRARSIAAIIQNTAQGVMAALTSYPPNIPLSILIGAIGAAQVAQVLARPIPKYATGTDYSPEGLAIVGERGPELRINPDGTQELTPGTASYAYLKEGTKIIPADITKNLINQSMLANVGGVQFKNEADFDRHTSRMIDAYRAETKDLKKAISSRPENYVSITEGGFKTSVKKSGGWYNYINNKFSN